MASAGSVTYWIDQLKAGKPAAAQEVWERYFQRLVGLARKKLQGALRRVEDEEDVALSAFDSFCRGAGRGRFPKLNDRNDLWQLLVLITARKAIDLRNREGRLKRGGGRPAAAPPPGPGHDSADLPGLDQVIGPEPTPSFAAQVAEECQRLLQLLQDESLRSVALWKMEGYTTEEIARFLGCVPRTVERKLQLIRNLWEQGGAP
jgi:DNA-directed RNA polymerase specialized sigma24 family protein